MKDGTAGEDVVSLVSWAMIFPSPGDGNMFMKARSSVIPMVFNAITLIFVA